MALRDLFICYGGTTVISVWARRHKKTEAIQGRQPVVPVTGSLETRAKVSPEALLDKLTPEARAHLAAREKTTAEVLKQLFKAVNITHAQLAPSGRVAEVS